MTFGSPGRGSRSDADGLRQEIDRLSRDQRRSGSQPLVITEDRPLFIRSPDGTYWRLQVDNTGVLSTANVGATL